MDKLSRQQFESAFMDIFGNPSGIITQENIRDLDIGLEDLEALWNASRSVAVTLPPMLNLDGRTGRSFILAGAHNSAITMCSMAITEAGYKSECSALLDSEVCTNG